MATRMRVFPVVVPVGMVSVPLTAPLLAPLYKSSFDEKVLSRFKSIHTRQFSAYEPLMKPGWNEALLAPTASGIAGFAVKSAYPPLLFDVLMNEATVTERMYSYEDVTPRAEQ